MTEKYFGGVLPFEVLLRLDKENEEKKKTVLDPEIIAFLNDMEDLLNQELKNSRFFSLSTFIESVKRIRGDGDSISYNSEMMNPVSYTHLTLPTICRV